VFFLIKLQNERQFKSFSKIFINYHYKMKSGYYGEFRNGIAHGRGINIFKNGDRYEGEYKNDQINGRGTYYAKKKAIIMKENLKTMNFMAEVKLLIMMVKIIKENGKTVKDMVEELLFI
jgi:hypothetical protein